LKLDAASARRTVLVVDDDKDIVDTLCDILELRGYATLRAYDGLDAVTLASERPVDWVIMDVRMPKLTGVEALQVIKRQVPTARVVLMTAFASPDLAARAASAGAATVLHKPFDPSRLLNLIEGESGET
jgi:two-component system, NtrC family, response regulator HydG